MPYNHRIIFLSLSIFSSSLAIANPPINIKPLNEPDASEIIHNLINNKQQKTSEFPIKNLPPITITPLYDYDIADLIKLIEQSPRKNDHSPHVQEKRTLQYFHSEGKHILTITYISTSPEGLAFLKEKYPDTFEDIEKIHQKCLFPQKTIETPLSKIESSLEKKSQ